MSIANLVPETFGPLQGVKIVSTGTLIAQPFAGAHAKLLNANFVDASAAIANEPEVRAWDAALRSNGDAQKPVAGKRAARSHRNGRSKPVFKGKSKGQTLLAGDRSPQPMPEYVTVREEFVVVVTQRTQDSAVQQSWQMHVVAISVRSAKPAKQVPRKT